jgi:D-alanyl-D-alanine carboxypeptidase/D-alanyl-D-alanine-endopeptidase (penicillin-binding protein 4)
LIDALCTYFLQQKPGNNTWARLFGANHRIQYQQKPAQSELQRSHLARWRQLETVVKHAVQGQTVSVIFRGNELLLQDNQPDVSSVLNALKSLRGKYNFAVALESKEKPAQDGRPLVLWSDLPKDQLQAKRLWVIREATS